MRFDRNAYSIPHTYVRRPLTLLASATAFWVAVRRSGAVAATGAILATTVLMGLLIVQAVFGTPPSTNIGYFLLYNIVDVIAPFLILLRVIPQPLFRRSVAQ